MAPPPPSSEAHDEQSSFTILYFASAATFTRKSSERFAGPCTVGELYARLEKAYPGIKTKILDHVALTINLDYVDVDTAAARDQVVVQPGDEVGVIPPVSAG